MDEWSTFLEDLDTHQLYLLTEVLIVAMDSASSAITGSRLSACRGEICERKAMHEGGLGLRSEFPSGSLQ